MDPTTGQLLPLNQGPFANTTIGLPAIAYPIGGAVLGYALWGGASGALIGAVAFPIAGMFIYGRLGGRVV